MFDNLTDQLFSVSFARWYLLLSALATITLGLYFISRLPLFGFTSPVRTPYRLLRLGSLFILILITFTLAGYLFYPGPDIITPSIPVFEPLTLTASQPLRLEFDRPFSRQIAPGISPKVPGEWSYDYLKYGPLVPDTLIFTPSESLAPGQEYTVSINKVLPISWLRLDRAKRILFVFHTSPPPEITSSSVVDGAEDVPSDQAFTFDLSHQSPDHIQWQYALTPSHPAVISLQNTNQQIHIVPESALNHNTQYQLQIIRTPVTLNYSTGLITATGESALAGTINFTTTPNAAIQNITPSGDSITLSTPISIQFSEAMDRTQTQTAFSLSPATPGIIAWQGDNLFSFIPQDNWLPATTYTITINQSAKTQKGGSLAEDITHQFTSVGEVGIAASQPTANAAGISITSPISITFNQPVERSSIESNFRLTPATAGTWSWQDLTAAFTPSQPLSHQTSYQATFEPGLKSIDGVDSTKPISFSFTTAPDQFTLNIPLIKQNYNFTCFAAASQMVLSYRGITSVTELGFMEAIGYDTTPRNHLTNTWGDPSIGIVGTYDGSGPGGYGAHWQPVAAAIEAHRPVEIKRSWNIPELLKTVSEDNPVMVWWVNGVWPAKDISWNISSGGKAYAVNGMHVEVVRGWIGDIENPDYILTNDPWRGERRYTPEQFANLWRWFSNTAVIVY